MHIYKNPAYRRVVFIGLLLQVITAWFSVGYNYPDEHFQVFEFCNYKLGFSPASALPWEYTAQIRSAMQPFMVYCVARVLLAINLYNPFSLAFLFRLAMGLLTWAVTNRLARQLLPEFITDKGKKLFIWCAYLLWFVPYVGVRFSAENFAGLLFMLSLSYLLDTADTTRKQGLKWAFAGLLLGLALYMRLQIGFAYVGLAIYLLFIRKTNWLNLATLIITGILGIGISVAVDRWFYGAWIFPPYNYYYTQIVQNIAAKWGVYPWWYYFKMFFETAVPPISIVLLLFFFLGLIRKPKHIISVSTITFLIGHMIIGHKELRFLFPVILPFIFLACVGVDSWLARRPLHKAVLISFRVIVGLNIALLLFKAFTPAQEAVNYFRYIYNHSKESNDTLLAIERSPYDMDNLEANFYKPQGLKVLVIANASAIDSLKDTLGNSPVLLIDQYKKDQHYSQTYKNELQYCIFPDWVLHVNVNNWQDRSRIWAIYRLTPAGIN
jgi:phosphatidylinositol glycan class B